MAQNHCAPVSDLLGGMIDVLSGSGLVCHVRRKVMPHSEKKLGFVRLALVSGGLQVGVRCALLLYRLVVRSG